MEGCNGVCMACITQFWESRFIAKQHSSACCIWISIFRGFYFDCNCISYRRRAEMLRANFNSSSFVAEKCPDRLVPGIYEFGRSILKFQDMRVSKTQVQLDIWPDRVSVTRVRGSKVERCCLVILLTSISRLQKGKNLSCIARSNGVIKLEVDEPVELKAGDTLYLLVSLYPISFESDSRPFSAAAIASALESTSSTHSDPSNSKKRERESVPVLPASAASGTISKLQIDDSDDESDSNDGVVLLSKKSKLQEAATVPSPISATGHWSTGLLQYMKDPSKHGDVVVTFTDQLVVIKDKFPKAKLHLLVLPRQPLQNLSSLTKEHISLLESMERVASTLAQQWMANNTSTEVLNLGSSPSPMSHRVLIGFHAVPSMSQLHLHIISGDFDSPGLKTKKHWNSFNSPFFISPSKVIQSLQVSDRVQLDKTLYEAYLESPLKCHRCSQTMPNMPVLKTHISTCSKDV